jgi:hypothetical protein
MRFNPSPYSPEMPDLGNYGLMAQRNTSQLVGVLRQGARGGDVAKLHEALDSNNPRRRYVTDANATEEMYESYFGPKTKIAVEAFQKDKKLGVDGIVGKNTWDALGTVNTKFSTTGATAPAVTASGDDATRRAADPGFNPFEDESEKVWQKPWFWPVAIGGGVLVLGVLALTLSGGRSQAIVTTRPRMV